MILFAKILVFNDYDLEILEKKTQSLSALNTLQNYYDFRASKNYAGC